MEYQQSRITIDSKYNKYTKLKTLSKKSEEGPQKAQANTFIFDSTDRYIKKILIQHNWKLVNSQYKNYALKWVYLPKRATFNELEDGQKINHFPNTHILTTKLGLKRTLTGERSSYLGWNGRCHSSYFPRSYDLSEQFQLFQRDFTRTAVGNLTKKIMVAIEIQSQSIFDQLNEQILCKKYKEKNWLKQVRQLLDYNLLWQQDLSLLKTCRLRLNSSIFQPLLCLLAIIFTLDTPLKQEDFSYKQLKQLVAYSLHNPPYRNIQSHFSGKKQLARLPSLSALKIFFHLYKSCFENWCWFKSDGLRNIWVVKASDSSRGRSIYLVESVQQAHSLNNGMRLIQKYIQNVWIYRPYLFSNKNSILQRIENKKFDIRLWVIVKSFTPLEAYIYEQGYLRISHNSYQLIDISSQKSHLTNFSVNWKHQQNAQQSYMLLSEYFSFLDSSKLKKSSVLRQQINNIISQTLYAAELQINSGDSHCFEFLGFDIILDGDLRPWLLECNMSPACRQRGVLTKVVEEMGTGMLSLLGIISRSPFETKWHKISQNAYSVSSQKIKKYSKCFKENNIIQHYKSQQSIKSFKRCGSNLNENPSLILKQQKINSLLPLIPSSSFHSPDQSLVIKGCKLSPLALTKKDTKIYLMLSILKIQRFIRDRVLLKKQTQAKPSLRCLNLLEILARINKKRLRKSLRYIKKAALKYKKTAYNSL